MPLQHAELIPTNKNTLLSKNKSRHGGRRCQVSRRSRARHSVAQSVPSDRPRADVPWLTTADAAIRPEESPDFSGTKEIRTRRGGGGGRKKRSSEESEEEGREGRRRNGVEKGELGKGRERETARREREEEEGEGE